MRRDLPIPVTIAALLGVGLALAFFAHLLFASVRRDGFRQPSAEMQPRAAGTRVVAAISPYIDVHCHLDPANAVGAIQATLEAMHAANTAKLIFMPSPFTPDDRNRFDDEVILAGERGHRDKLVFLGGGGTLNVMIQRSVRSGDVGSDAQRQFKQRAEEIIRQGAAGFGEIAGEHFATSPSAYYEYAPPDHPLLLVLADVSAQHGGAPIDFHMEAVPQSMPLPADLRSPPNPPQLHPNIAAFERLLEHNPHAQIVWAHAGWDNTGYRTADLCGKLLRAHPNLYMEIKVDPVDVGKNSILTNGGRGAIKPEWLTLFQEFPDRFVMGTDQHYPEPVKGPQRWQAAVLLFNQLPADLRRKIGLENPTRIYHLRSSAR